MTPSLTLLPSTVAPSTGLDILGAGFDPQRKVQLACAGIGWTTNYFRPAHDGSFKVGMTAPASEGPAPITVRYSGNPTLVAPPAILTVAKPVTPPVTPPTPPPTGATRVVTVKDLLQALADDVPSIVMANGRYRISTAGTQAPLDGAAPPSLWIGSIFAGRKNEALVQAETPGGVIFDLGGAGYSGGISFNEGAHDQDWFGFEWANAVVTETGLITFGGYATAPAHHIKMRGIKIGSTVKGSGTRYQGKALDHGVYIGHNATPNHDLAFEDFVVDAGGGLSSAFQLYGTQGANNIAFRRFDVSNADQALLIYDASLRNIAFEDGKIRGSAQSAVTYVHPGQGITLTRVNSTGSPNGKGLYAPEGQSGLTLVDSVLG